MCECSFLQSPEEGTRSPGAGVIGACDPPDVAAGDLARVLCKDTMYSTSEPPLQIPFLKNVCAASARGSLEWVSEPKQLGLQPLCVTPKVDAGIQTPILMTEEQVLLSAKPSWPGSSVTVS